MTDERDIRDPALDAAWQAQSTETPPSALDAAILAAAHRAVKSAPEKIGPGREATRPWRWWAPLAAAAVIGVIAIGAIQLMPREPDPTKSVVSDTPTDAVRPPPSPAQPPLRADAPPAARQEAAGPRENAPAITDAKPAARQETAKPATKALTIAPPAPVERESKVAATPPEPFPSRRDADAATFPPGASGSPPAPASPPAAAKPEAPAPAAAPAESRSRASAAASLSAPSASGAAAPMLSKRESRDDAQRLRTPEDFVTRIRKLIDDGNVAEAQRELVAFRAAYLDADTRLPTDLRPWAASVPRN